MSGATCEVVVGNVGAVYSGSEPEEAQRVFDAYVAISRSGVGRAGGESVTLWRGGEPAAEHVGSIDQREHRSKERD